MKIKMARIAKQATTVQKEVFNTDIFYQGAAINITIHTGEEFRAIISDAGFDYIQCYRVDPKTREAKLVELFIEEYISGTYNITRL